MPDLKKTIEIIFGASDNTGSAFDSVKSSLSDLESYADPFGGIADSVLTATERVAAFSAVIAGIATYKAGSFEDGVKEIGALFAANSDQVIKLEDDILEFSLNSSSSIDRIIGATYNVISATGDYENTLKSLADAEQLADAGSVGLSVAMGVLNTSMNAYGAEAEEASRYSDILFTIVQNGVTDLTKLDANIGRVTSTANAAGVPFEDLGAAIASITAETGNTSETMTKLNSLIKELVKPSENLEAALGSVSFTGNNLKETMGQLKTATGGSYEEMVKLFGSSEATAAAVILANDSSSKFANTLTIMSENIGVVTRESAKMSDNFGRNVTTLVNNLDAALIQIGKPLLNNFSDSVSAANSIMQGFGKGLVSPNFAQVNTQLDNFTLNLRQWGADIGDVLPEAMADIDFSGLILAISSLGEEFAQVFDLVFGKDLDLSQPEDLAEALQKAVNILESIVNITTGIIDSFSPLFEGMGELASATGETNKELELSIGQFLGAAKAISDFGAAFGLMIITLKQSGGDVGVVLNNIVQASRLIINQLQIAFDLLAGGIAIAIEKVAAGLATIVSPFDRDLSQEFQALADEYELLGEGIRNSIVTNMEDADDAADKFGKQLFDTTEKGSRSLNKIKDSSDQSTAALKETTAETKQVELQMKLASDEAKQLQNNTKEIELATIAASTKAAELSTSIKLGAQETERAAIQARVALEEIASKNYRARLELDIRNAELATQRFQSSMETLANTIQSTGGTLNTLYDNFGTGDYFYNKVIEDQINSESAMRREAHEKQMRLIELEIQAQQRKAQRDAQGLSEITVSADGLAPELEAFMWAILERVKIRASQDQANFLLGTD